MVEFSEKAFASDSGRERSALAELCKVVPRFRIWRWPLNEMGCVDLPEKALLYLYPSEIDLFEKDDIMLRLERIMGFFGRRTHCEIQNNGRLLLFELPVLVPAWSMLSSDGWGPIARLNCLLFFLQFAEEVRNLFMEKIVKKELRFAVEILGMPQEDILQGIKASMEPFLLMRDHLLPRLEKYVGRAGVHDAIINEFKNAFDMLIPYLVADDLGGCFG